MALGVAMGVIKERREGSRGTSMAGSDGAKGMGGGRLSGSSTATDRVSDDEGGSLLAAATDIPSATESAATVVGLRTVAIGAFGSMAIGSCRREGSGVAEGAASSVGRRARSDGSARRQDGSASLTLSSITMADDDDRPGSASG